MNPRRENSTSSLPITYSSYNPIKYEKPFVQISMVKKAAKPYTPDLKGSNKKLTKK